MTQSTSFAADRPLDIVCLGRLAVDLYAQQIGARLEDVTSLLMPLLFTVPAHGQELHFDETHKTGEYDD
ncbi:hypothetical protein [Paraburkholderia sp. SIMBA_030]|uniref:hypothetical protein n=1 Tax=Paraburkholderia sp. SIMBA_030 TaxID=3085773 RepID=UPI003978512D